MLKWTASFCLLEVLVFLCQENLHVSVALMVLCWNIVGLGYLHFWLKGINNLEKSILFCGSTLQCADLQGRVGFPRCS